MEWPIAIDIIAKASSMALYERRIIYPLCLIFILWYINKFQATLNIHVAQFPEYIQDICFS